MCGVAIGTDAKRCLSCGESFALCTPKQTLLQFRIVSPGLLPSAIVGMIAGASIGLIVFACEWIIDPKNDFSLGRFVIGLLICLLIGTVIGVSFSSVPQRTSSSDPDHP